MSADAVVMTQAVAVSVVLAVSTSANIVSSGVDLSGYEGVVQVVQNLGGITGTFSGAKLQDSADNSTFADITGATFGTTQNALTSVNLDVRNVRRYIRYSVNISTNPAAVSVTLTGIRKVKP